MDPEGLRIMSDVATSKITRPKHDLYLEHAADYLARHDPAIVNIARCQYLAIDGSGAPGCPEFEASWNVLRRLAHTLKMGRYSHTAPLLECLLPDTLTWTLLVRTPDFITREDLAASHALQAVRLLPLVEGWCVQALHDGNLYDVPDTLDKMRECAALAGTEFYGTLHEIYLDEPHAHAPRHRRTILRQPLRDC